MPNLVSMTFHESYGELPKGILSAYRRYNVSPSDHDAILANFGKSYGDSDIPWSDVLDFVLASVEGGTFRRPIYM